MDRKNTGQELSEGFVNVERVRADLSNLLKWIRP
jgi:hypothetical protein